MSSSSVESPATRRSAWRSARSSSATRLVGGLVGSRRRSGRSPRPRPPCQPAPGRGRSPSVRSSYVVKTRLAGNSFTDKGAFDPLRGETGPMVSLGVRTSAAYLAVYVVGVVCGLLSVNESGLAFFWPAAGIGSSLDAAGADARPGRPRRGPAARLLDGRERPDGHPPRRGRPVRAGQPGGGPHRAVRQLTRRVALLLGPAAPPGREQARPEHPRDRLPGCGGHERPVRAPRRATCPPAA